MNFILFIFTVSLRTINGQLDSRKIISELHEGNVDVSKLEGLLNGDLVFIDCQIDSMCAFMSESWLNSEGIFESDTPFLSLGDDSCIAQDIGSLEGIPDEHFWLWCSREFTAEEELEHEDEEENSLSHYNCGTQTSIHQGDADPGSTSWKVEPHIRHNNTISTKGANLRKTINIPFECEWPTTFGGQDPLGFKIGDNPFRYQTEANIVLQVKMTLYQDESFQFEYSGQPEFGGCSSVDCDRRIFIGLKLDENVQDDIGLNAIHLWATPEKLGFPEDGQPDYYYAWIAAECATNDNLQIYDSGSASEIWISLPIFKFKAYDSVYFHAIVKACKGDCESICADSNDPSLISFNDDRETFSSTSRLRRSTESRSLLTIGPITVNKTEIENSYFLPIIAFSFAIVSLIILGIINLYVYIRNKRFFRYL